MSHENSAVQPPGGRRHACLQCRQNSSHDDAELPRDQVDLVIVVDDGSSDETTRIAREMGLQLFVHNRNYGYGANQKTCYREALKAGAEIVVMVHPDYQYDPSCCRM